MKMKMDDVLVANRAINDLRASQTKLPVKVSLILHSNLKALQNNVTAFNEISQEIATKYAEKDDEGNPIVAGQGQYNIPAESQQAMMKEMEEALVQEVEVSGLTFLPLSTFDTLDLAMDTALGLSFMLAETA